MTQGSQQTYAPLQPNNKEDLFAHRLCMESVNLLAIELCLHSKLLPVISLLMRLLLASEEKVCIGDGFHYHRQFYHPTEGIPTCIRCQQGRFNFSDVLSTPSLSPLAT